MQEQQPAPSQPGPINISLNLDALAELIWRWLIDHIGEIGTVAWGGIRQNLPEIGGAFWTPFSSWLLDGLRSSAAATWASLFGAVPLLFSQLPPALTYDLPAYRAIATNPVPLALGGATLALVLLGLRTLFGAMVGRDHVITHITGRLIPAVFLTLAYPVVIAQAIGLINSAAAQVGPQSMAGMFAMPLAPNTSLALPYAVLLLVMLWYGVRLLIRTAYGLFRFLVALVFGPVALILWAIPQTEWVTDLWLRELVGWGTTPLLVVVCLALSIPLAAGQAGFLGAVAFGIAGLQAAHDLVGLLTHTRGGGGGSPLGYVQRAASMARGGGAGVAAASIPANRTTTLADQYGYQ